MAAIRERLPNRRLPTKGNGSMRDPVPRLRGSELQQRRFFRVFLSFALSDRHAGKSMGRS
jgi:hypothetical protein